MDEIELAMRLRDAKDRAKGAPVPESSDSVPAALLGMTAVASEAGTIDASIAGKDIKNVLKGMEEFDVVESAVTLAEKGGLAQLKFKYGRNSTEETEAGAKGVQKASRKVSEPKKPRKTVKVAYPPPSKRSSIARGKTPETEAIPSDKQRPRSNSKREAQYFNQLNSSDSDTPNVHPKSALRNTPSPTLERASMETVQDLRIPDPSEDAKTSKLEHRPVSSSDDPKSSPMTPRTPAMPTYKDLQTKSNPELAAQLIARALRVDFVYFMRLTPITAKSPNKTSYPNAQVNLELIGCYGLPFPTISFSPFTHLEALRSDLGMIYYSNTHDENGMTSDDSVTNAKDNFRVGIVVPVWREYPRSSLTTARASANRRSIGADSINTSTTIASLRENCRKGVVVGVFSKRGERKTFTRIEREYLKEWVSLRDHL
jgi:hypothetical protein